MIELSLKETSNRCKTKQSIFLLEILNEDNYYTVSN